MQQQYNNELTPEVLAGLDVSPFSPEDIASMNSDARETVMAQAEYCRQHPVSDIYRVAVAGCITRRGGVGDEINHNPAEGDKLQLANGQWVSILTEGCTVSYSDGSKAKIVSSAGAKYTSVNGRGIALVGSQLDNGDEIIGTPQDIYVLLSRNGVSMPQDFLSVSGE